MSLYVIYLKPSFKLLKFDMVSYVIVFYFQEIDLGRQFGGLRLVASPQPPLAFRQGKCSLYEGWWGDGLNSSAMEFNGHPRQKAEYHH